jgi:pimeloyl-ACP methyl ester carboxylesterase
VTAAKHEVSFVNIAGGRLEYRRVDMAASHAAPVVLLHEGLGSVAMWRAFPQRLATVTRRDVVAYSRFGHGRSSPATLPRSVRYMHEEALQILPQFLDALGITRPILLGHSDGASITLIYTGGANRDVAGLIVMAPHVFVEDISVSSIAAARHAFEKGNLRQRLARYHDDVDATFGGWNEVWLRPEFRDWNIEKYLPAIACPVLAIQGENDEYGTMEQVHRIDRAVEHAEVLGLPSCGHAPHRDCPDAVLNAIARFVDRLD